MSCPDRPPLGFEQAVQEMLDLSWQGQPDAHKERMHRLVAQKFGWLAEEHEHPHFARDCRWWQAVHEEAGDRVGKTSDKD